MITLAVVLAFALPASASATDPWSQLHRPLRLQPLAAGAACPVTRPARLAGAPIALLGAGPVFPGLAPNPVRVDRYDLAPAWLGAKTIWAWPPALTHRHMLVLVRGLRLDGGGPVRFQLGPQWGSAPITRELRIDSTKTVGSFSGSRWGTTVTMILVKSPGCYGLQLDSSVGTTTVVVDARR
ncbi:MAG TPA: hypothetical protein VGG88_07140 [Gaiellaceae bacterium]